MTASRNVAAAVLACISLVGCVSDEDTAVPVWPNGEWVRHTIDDSSVGADGVRLADINGDGLLDIVSPWEQGGVVRLYLNPGASSLRDRWPAVTVGEVGDPEDAFFVDLDDNGVLDVVSSSEGGTRAIHVHWAPDDPDQLLNADAWSTEPIGVSVDQAKWMYAVAVDSEYGMGGVRLIAGAKDPGGQIALLQPPEDPRDLDAWNLKTLYEAGWMMTLRLVDMDADGDNDVVATDRRDERRGALWLENPDSGSAWQEHRIGAVGTYEAMHHAVGDLDGDGVDDIVVAVKRGPIRFFRRSSMDSADWETHIIEMPEGSGGGKSVAIADVDLDGQPDLVVACEGAHDGRIGVFWYAHAGSPQAGPWTPTSIAGPEGFIYDLIQLVDLDGDGDLDVATLEEKGPYFADGFVGKELGVIWYENPLR